MVHFTKVIIKVSRTEFAHVFEILNRCFSFKGCTNRMKEWCIFFLSTISVAFQLLLQTESTLLWIVRHKIQKGAEGILTGRCLLQSLPVCVRTGLLTAGFSLHPQVTSPSSPKRQPAMQAMINEVISITDAYNLLRAFIAFVKLFLRIHDRICKFC